MLVGLMLVVVGMTSEARACSPAEASLREILPADGAVDVPAASVVRVAWNEGLGMGGTSYEWIGPDGAAVPFDVVVAPGGIDAVEPSADYAELAAKAPLADGAHEIHVLRNAVVVGTSGFTVAGDTDISTPDAPTGADFAVVEHAEADNECGYSDSRSASLTITPDPDGNSVVHVIRESSGEVVASFASADLGAVVWTMDIVPGVEECVTLVQENAIGDESPASAPICADVEGATESESGCQTAPGSFGAGALVLLAALVTRRKRAI